MDKQHKKQIKKYISCSVIALLVIILTVMPLIASKNASSDGPQASILQTTAEGRTIRTQLIGGGQLASSATEEITIPEDIRLTEYLVGNGDTVRRGDPIARVDKVSVMSALASVQETLDYLADEIADAANSSDADEVRAHAGGLVKVLYGQAGDSVRDVMLEYGTLAVLSLDGRMAVDISRNTDLKTGSSVCVYLEDGTDVAGRVESSAGGTLTVSIEDTGYAIGEKVTVKTEDGARLGSGTLYIHNAWNAAAYYGTITKVNVKEGDNISAGKALFSLETSDYSAQFQILNAQRQKYEALMQELFQLYHAGVIEAPCDGIVTGVDTSGSFLLAAAEQDWQPQLLGNSLHPEQPSYSVILLSSEQPVQSEKLPAPEIPEQIVIPGAEQSPVPPSAEEDSSPAEPAPGCTKSEDCPGLVHEPGCPLSGVTQTLYSGWVAIVQQVEDGSAVLKKNPNAIQTSNIEALTVDPTALTEEFVYPGTVYTDGVALSPGDTVFLHLQGGITKITGASGSSGDGQQPQQGAEMGGMPGSMGSGMSGGMGGSSIPVFEPYSLETLTIASVTSQEEITLEITIDQQDIAVLYPGQEAIVTIEALTGQSFPAMVTTVSNTGTNTDGGSSKFTATLALTKSGDMLPGMNASAYLTLNTAENVVSIPAAALVEDGSKTIVYTGYNERDSILKNPIEVTTGVSDGEYVEILSGLTAGDTVYYAYYDTPEISNTPKTGRIGF